MTPPAVVAAARAYLGTPFVHVGRSALGVDCVGLLILAGKDAGLILPGYQTRLYSRVVNPAVLRAELVRFLRPLAEDEPTAVADVALFRCDGWAQHVGLFTEPAEPVNSGQWSVASPDPPALTTDHCSPATEGGAGWAFIHTNSYLGRVVEHALDTTWSERLAERFRWREF